MKVRKPRFVLHLHPFLSIHIFLFHKSVGTFKKLFRGKTTERERENEIVLYLNVYVDTFHNRVQRRLGNKVSFYFTHAKKNVHKYLTSVAVFSFPCVSLVAL